MARKPGQTTRSKKTSKPMRAVSRPTVDQPAMKPAEPKAFEGEARREMTSLSGGPSAASKKGRPYQHRKTSPTARMSAATATPISKAQEYAFIREDLRRLLITAGILIVVMIVLLLVIGR